MSEAAGYLASMLTQEDVEACPGLTAQLRLLSTYAAWDRPVLIRGETSTVRAVIPRLAKGTSPHEIYCPLMSNAAGALREALVQHSAHLARHGLVSFVEMDRLSADDQRLLAIVARDRIIDGRGTRLMSRLVCQFDPRYASVSWIPGLFLEVDLPPLASRPDDAAVLLTRLLTRQLGGEVRLDGLALEAATAYPWPGDVAELVARAEQIAGSWAADRHRLVVNVEELGITHVTGTQRRARTQATEGRTLQSIMEEYEAEVIQLVMTRSRGNKSHVARELGISRSYLIQKCQKYGVE